jgi:hypothetical protein
VPEKSIVRRKQRLNDGTVIRNQVPRSPPAAADIVEEGHIVGQCAR